MAVTCEMVGDGNTQTVVACPVHKPLIEGYGSTHNSINDDDGVLIVGVWTPGNQRAAVVSGNSEVGEPPVPAAPPGDHPTLTRR